MFDKFVPVTTALENWTETGVFGKQIVSPCFGPRNRRVRQKNERLGEIEGLDRNRRVR